MSTRPSAGWRAWWRRHARPGDGSPGPAEHTPIELGHDDSRRLSSVFEPPRWLRDLGRASWFLVGVVALLVGVVWLLAQTSTIAEPVLVGLVVATVASPIVGALQRRGLPRVAGAALVLLGLLGIAALVLVLVLGGIMAERDSISETAGAAADRAEAWLEDAGVDSGEAQRARQHVESATPETLSTLTEGIAEGIAGIASLVFAASFTVFSLFFLLKDGPAFRGWVDRHLGVPAPVARTITGDAISALRRYFTGVTIVAAFNGVVVGLGAILLGVPLAGTIAVVTFVTAYVPFIGAFVAGAFAVVLALGDGGTTTALVMLVIVLLANGLLQNVVQPIAFGATLDLNPLLVLVVTISAGSLFGMIGLVLAAPLLSAAIHIASDLAEMRETPERLRREPGPLPAAAAPD